ncbi:uncharacterized protein LODBEIA_P39700 [Lodderomyces beijingensis]|uniref:Something about silencing protein 4 domain-containing protein n=1 Tax=Lodderomyces beijingensis TaxID=1775926 RepID=A0ABP0ZNL4_9ASCO
MNSPRRLRSNDTLAKDPHPNNNLFNFDKVNQYLYNAKPIQISADASPNWPLYHFYTDDASLSPKPSIDPAKFKIIKLDASCQPPSSSLPPLFRTKKNDPLPASKFEIFHRKMRKDEKQMLNDEKIRHLSELDTLQHNLALLHQYDWIRHLPQITHIQDKNDLQEMELKRDLTVAEIERIMARSAEWRKKKDAFVLEMKNFDVVDDDDNDDLEYDVAWEKSMRFGESGNNKNNKDNNENKKKDKNVKNKDKKEKEKGLETPRVKKLTLKLGPPPSPKVHTPKSSQVKGASALERAKKLEEVGKEADINLFVTDTPHDYIFGCDFQDIPASITGFQLPQGLRRLK